MALSVCHSTHILSFSRQLIWKNIVTLNSRLGVTHPANLCTICTWLKSTNPELSFCHW